jgi:hypothetical protein
MPLVPLSRRLLLLRQLLRWRLLSHYSGHGIGGVLLHRGRLLLVVLPMCIAAPAATALAARTDARLQQLLKCGGGANVAPQVAAAAAAAGGGRRDQRTAQHSGEGGVCVERFRGACRCARGCQCGGHNEGA